MRTPSPTLPATIGPAFTPPRFAALDELVRRVQDDGVCTCSAVEPAFLRAVESFDSGLEAAPRPAEIDHDHVARCFTNLTSCLLRNVSGQPFVGPAKCDSHLFDEVELDICFLVRGTPRAAASVKAVASSACVGHDETRRTVRRELEDHVKQVGFSAFDLKAAYAKPTPIRTFQDWIQRAEPAYFSFWAVRVEDATDFESVRSILVGLQSYCNGVGAIIYAPVPGSKRIEYEAKKVPELGMDKALRRMAQSMA